MRAAEARGPRGAPLNQSSSHCNTGGNTKTFPTPTLDKTSGAKKAFSPPPQRAVLRCGDLWRGVYRPTVLPGRAQFVERDIRDACCEFQTRLAQLQLRVEESAEQSSADFQQGGVRKRPLPAEGSLSVFCEVFIHRLLGGLLQSVPLESEEEVWSVFCDVWEGRRFLRAVLQRTWSRRWGVAEEGLHLARAFVLDLFCQSTSFSGVRETQERGPEEECSPGADSSCEDNDPSAQGVSAAAASFVDFLEKARASSIALASSAAQAAAALKWSEGECVRVQRVGLLCLLLLSYYSQPRSSDSFVSSASDCFATETPRKAEEWKLSPPRSIRLAVGEAFFTKKQDSLRHTDNPAVQTPAFRERKCPFYFFRDRKQPLRNE